MERDGEPVQVVHPATRVALPVVELDRLAPGAREREAERLAGTLAARPFDLAAGPLFRALLARLGADDHVLCFSMHQRRSTGSSRPGPTGWAGGPWAA